LEISREHPRLGELADNVSVEIPMLWYDGPDEAALLSQRPVLTTKNPLHNPTAKIEIVPGMQV